MTIQEYLSESIVRRKRAAGTVGVESDWLEFCTITVRSGILWVGDPEFSWAEIHEGVGCVVGVPPGIYRVEARGMDFKGVKLISRLRACRTNIKTPILGQEVDSAGTDSGQIGIADPSTLKEAFDAVCGDDVDQALDLLREQTRGDFGIVRPDPASTAALAFVPSGFGDGAGPVFELISRGNRRVVGIELEFIATGQCYYF